MTGMMHPGDSAGSRRRGKAPVVREPLNLRQILLTLSSTTSAVMQAGRSLVQLFTSASSRPT